MSKAHELAKRINQLNQELARITKAKFDLDFKVNQIKEELWRLEGSLEEETDENEYQGR